MHTLAKTRLLLLIALLCWQSEASAQSLRFRVRLETGVADRPVAGRLYVFVSQRKHEPRFGPDWFRPEPFFAIDVPQFQPGTSLDVDEQADGFPASLARLRPGEYYVQAVLDHSFDIPQPGQAPGNYYSPAAKVPLDPNSTGTVELALNRIVDRPPFPESRWVEELAVPSELLSQFHGREVIEPAAIVLPRSYFNQAKRRYPVMFIISGFGGDYRKAALQYVEGPPPLTSGEVEFIRVLLAGQCRWGHHVYANSATNGPRGDALVKEVISEIDRRYRTIPKASARFVTGHSSGGWASLWLMVNYPETFGGVWSLAPDPVDFRDFQGIDLYASPPQNFFRDLQERPRPVARHQAEPVLWYEPFVRMDDVLKRGGQIRSFEAVFSPLGLDGLPMRVFDRTTGRVKPQVAQAWQSYDIRALLERHWPVLGPKLQGRLHIFAAEFDTFYLEGAVKRLAGTLRKLGSDAEIKIISGTDHSSMVTMGLYLENRRAMSQAFLRSHSSDVTVRQ